MCLVIYASIEALEGFQTAYLNNQFVILPSGGRRRRILPFCEHLRALPEASRIFVQRSAPRAAFGRDQRTRFSSQLNIMLSVLSLTKLLIFSLSELIS